MKKIGTLVDDIYQLLSMGYGSYSDFLDHKINDPDYTKREEYKENDRGGLRVSNIGRPCVRQLWYAHNGEDEVSLEGKTKFFFQYGHFVEDYILWLAEMSGHSVQSQQKTVQFDIGNGNKIVGHIDAIIDGVVIDVKTAGDWAFSNFENNLQEDDKFGYLTQLAMYVFGMNLSDGIPMDESYFLVVNKSTGEIKLVNSGLNKESVENLVYDAITKAKTVIESNSPPDRSFEPVPSGKSGNFELAVSCRYCPFKFKCFPETKVYAYSNGYKFLTTVSNEPKVPEVTDDYKSRLLE